MKWDKRFLVAAIIMFTLGVTGLTVAIINTSHRSQETQELTDKLVTVQMGVCSLRHDLKARIKQGLAFIDGLPKDQPFNFGNIRVTTRQLELNVAQQKRTLKALSVVEC